MTKYSFNKIFLIFVQVLFCVGKMYTDTCFKCILTKICSKFNVHFNIFYAV